MSYSVTQAKADLEGILHGTTLNQITGIDNLFYRAARDVLLEVDPQETKRIQPLASAIYDQVYDYALAADVKGNKIVDIRPQVHRDFQDNFNQSYGKPFDLSKTSLQDQFVVNFNTGVKTIRIADSGLVPGVVVNEADSTTSNGTWAAGGTASALTVDNVNYVSGGASLQFNAGIGAAYLENSTMSQQNLSTWKNQAHFFVWVYMPTASQFTNVVLRFGSDSSNYYSQTVTVTQQNTAFQNGWNLLDFAWNGSSQTGSPVDTAIDYIRVTANVTVAQTAVRLDNIVCRLGTILEMVYYSKYLFSDFVTGAWQETVTDDSDLINLDTESYNLFLYKLAYLAAQQQQGINATSFDAPYWEKEYAKALARYQNMYKSEVIQPKQLYYKLTRPGFGKYINWKNR